MILFTRLVLIYNLLFKATWVFCLALILLSACRSLDDSQQNKLQDYTSILQSSFIIPSNGIVRIHTHHASRPWVIAHNLSKNEVLVYNYEQQSILLQITFRDEPDWDPGTLYSLGFYQDGFYALGANGLFLFGIDGVLQKEWKGRMTRYNEYGILPSFILTKDGQDYLVARYRNFYLPKERENLTFWENVPYYRFISLIHLGMDQDTLEVQYVGGYASQSDVPYKLPTQGIRFTVDRDTLNIIFRPEGKVWQLSLLADEPQSYVHKPMNLAGAKNNYFISPGENINSMRNIAENIGVDAFFLDRANGDHYIEYQMAFDEEHWPNIYRLGLTWLNEEGNNYIKSRFVKYNTDRKSVV